MTTAAQPDAGPFEEMKQMIREFQEARVSAANLNWELYEKERNRQALRKTILEDLLGEGLTKTLANDQSRVEPGYVNASQEIENKTREWEYALAFAERTRLMVQVLLLEAQDTAHRDAGAIELKRMRVVLERRIKQLSSD